MSKFSANDTKFDFVRSLKLPLGGYAIVQSGALGIRGIREISDVDIIVSEKVWEQLSSEHQPVDNHGITQIRLGDCEIMHQGSFAESEPGTPSMAEQIAAAEIIDGLPFQNLEHLLFFKTQMNRPKDQADIATIKDLIEARRS